LAHPAVDKFGKLVVTQLRDRAIDFFDMAAKGKWKSPGIQSLQTQLAKLSPNEIALIRRCVVEAVDHGMHDMLFALVEAHDDGIEVIVDGENVVELSDGLHGEQFSDNGWIAKFGKHPELPEE